MRVFQVAIVVVVSVLIACSPAPRGADSSGERTPLTPDQAVQGVGTALTEFNGCVRSLRDGSGVVAIKNLLGLSDARVRNDDLLEDFVDALDWGDRIEDQRRFEIIRYAGTYSWNGTASSWDKEMQPLNAIIFNFPAQRGGSNDQRIELSGYSDVETHFDNNTQWLPTALRFAYSVGQMEQFGVTFSARWDGGDFSIPLELDLEVRLTPFVLRLAYDRSSPRQFALSTSVVDSGHPNCRVALQGTLGLRHDDYQNLDIESDLDRLAATVDVGRLQLAGQVDFRSLLAIDDPSASQINAFAKVSLLLDRAKIGDVVLRDDNRSEEIVVMLSDGSSRTPEQLTRSFTDQLELDLADFFDF
jgi:hypothetical protein